VIGSVVIFFLHVFFRGFNLDSQCEPIQAEIERLEACADEVQSEITEHKAEGQLLEEQLAKLEESGPALSADVAAALTQAYLDVLAHLHTLFFEYLYSDS